MAGFPYQNAPLGRGKVWLTALLCIVSMQADPSERGTAAASTQADRSAESSEVEPMEELIVTATYRDTLLMNTPIAISALNSYDLEAKGVENLQTLFQSVPGMSYGSDGATYNTISIRGLTAPTIGEPVVGVYIDNAPVTDNSAGIGQILGNTFDLERIEVLKGPQGTLYGESNMGGSVRYITNKPDPEAFSYKLKAGVEQMAHSNDLSSNLQGVVNIPLLDQRIAARIGAARRHRAGVLDAVAPRDQQDVNPETETSYRAAVSWFVTDDLELTLSGNWNRLNFSGPSVGFHCYTGATPLAPRGEVPAYAIGRTCPVGERDNFNRHPYETHLAFEGFENGGSDDHRLYNLNVEWGVPFAQLTSSTTYFERETNFAEEIPPRGSQPFAFINFIVPGANYQTGGADGVAARFNKRVTQELRAVSSDTWPIAVDGGCLFQR